MKCELEEDQDKAALLQIEEGFSDEKMKAQFLKIAQQQIDERKAREEAHAESRALCDEIGEMFEPVPEDNSRCPDQWREESVQ